MAIDQISRHGATRTSVFSAVVLRHFHGVATRVLPEATAVPVRDEQDLLEIITQWTKGDSKPHIAYNGNVVAFKTGRRQGGPSRICGRRAHPAPVLRLCHSGFPRRLSKTGAGRNRRATPPPAHFQRNPPSRGQLAVFPRCSLGPCESRYGRFGVSRLTLYRNKLT